MEKKLTFEELYEAYNLCLKNKKRKMGTYNFVKGFEINTVYSIR